MLYKSQKNIKAVGNLCYEVIFNDKYGVRVSDSLGNISSTEDIFDTYEEALEFIQLVEKYEVTTISMKEILEDYLYDKYRNKLEKLW